MQLTSLIPSEPFDFYYFCLSHAICLLPMELKHGTARTVFLYGAGVVASTVMATLVDCRWSKTFLNIQYTGSRTFQQRTFQQRTVHQRTFQQRTFQHAFFNNGQFNNGRFNNKSNKNGLFNNGLFNTSTTNIYS